MEGLGLDPAPREAVSWNDQYMDEDSSDEEELMPGVMADDPNKFNVLCEGVLNTIAFVHESLKEFLEAKDTLLQHHLPPSVLLSLSITSSKLFRSVTDMGEPVHELIRLVRIFSTPWEEKSAALKKILDDFHKKKRQLDVALKRLTLVDAMSKKIEYERRLLNWEKLYCKVTNVKGHGRRWKYTIDELKERAKQGYDVLVHHVDQIEQDINEPFPDKELRTESVAPQMDSIAEEREEGSHVEEERVARCLEQTSRGIEPTALSGLSSSWSAGEHFSDGTDSEDSFGPETPHSGFTIPGQGHPPVAVEPPPEVADSSTTTNPPEYDVIFFVRCYCPKGIEGRNIKCSITHGTQYEKTSRLDFTDEEIAKQLEDAPPPKPKGPKRKGAPPPPPEPILPKHVNEQLEYNEDIYSELRFKLPVKYVKNTEIPPRLESLTVTVHVGDDEEVVGMGTVEVEDIEGCEMPEIFELPKAPEGAYDLSLQDSMIYTANAKVDAELQLAEPLPVGFPIYPLGGGRAGAELQASGSVPLFFYYRKIYQPKLLNRASGTMNLRDLILEEIGVDIRTQTKETLFPEKRDMTNSPMTVRGTPTISRHSNDEDAVPAEELEAILDAHQRDMDLMQQSYERKIMGMHEEITRLHMSLENQAIMAAENPPRSSETISHADKENKHKTFQYKREKKDIKKIPKDQKLPKWGESLPADFFERLEMFQEESEANRRAAVDHIKREESENIEKKLAFQNKAFRGHQSDVLDALKDVSLPSLYNPNTGNNVYNPRVSQYFHPTGTTGLRLTQPPSMMSLPPLKNKMSVINLFDLGQSIHNPNTLLQKYMTVRNGREETFRSDAPANTADPSKRSKQMDEMLKSTDHPMSAGERLQTTTT